MLASFNKICSCGFLSCKSWAAFFHHSFLSKKPRDFTGTWYRLQQLRVTNQLLLGQKEKIHCWKMAGIVPFFQLKWCWVLLPSGSFCTTNFFFKSYLLLKQWFRQLLKVLQLNQIFNFHLVSVKDNRVGRYSAWTNWDFDSYKYFYALRLPEIQSIQTMGS